MKNSWETTTVILLWYGSCMWYGAIMVIERFVSEINGKYIYGIYYVENIINNTSNGG